jgi:rubrerythrin
MSNIYADRPENAAEGYKCSACGYMWNTKEAKDKCPSCGGMCNPYSCKIVISSNEDY